MSRRVRLVVGALAIVLSFALAFVARALFVLHEDFERGDARWLICAAQGSCPNPYAFADHGVTRSAARLLGLEDDIAYRQVAASFWTYELNAQRVGSLADRDRRQVQINARRLTSGGVAAELRSRAWNLLGVLTIVDLVRGTATVEQVAEMFRTAIQLDGANEAAKYNLELLLSLLTNRGGDEGTASGSSSGSSAGSSPPGTGY